jgi:hypothetical protein
LEVNLLRTVKKNGYQKGNVQIKNVVKNPQNKIGVEISKMDIFKNVQK